VQIAIALYPGFAALDAIGPYQVFSETPGLDTGAPSKASPELRELVEGVMRTNEAALVD